MARLNQMPEPLRTHVAELPCPQFDTTPWTAGTKLSEQRVAILSTAGLHRRGDRPFQLIKGVEATRQIKTELPSVRVVVLSMYQDKQSARIMIEAGADAFLTKSVSCAELLQTIRG